MKYGQFCPIAKATEILGEKWTILIVRELLMGGTRFNEFQRALRMVSPTILSRRLESLADYGLIEKRRIPGQRGYEYLPTKACKELLPIVMSLGEWGLRWAKANVTERDYDVELLMVYLKRSIGREYFTADETVIHFHFTDISRYPDWWIVLRKDDVELCVNDPGKDVDVWFVSSVKTMVSIWLDDTTYRREIRNGSLKVSGNPSLVRSVPEWMKTGSTVDMSLAAQI